MRPPRALYRGPEWAILSGQFVDGQDGQLDVLERCARASLAAVLRQYPRAQTVRVLVDEVHPDALGVRLATLLRPWRRCSVVSLKMPAAALTGALHGADLVVDAVAPQGSGTLLTAATMAGVRVVNQQPATVLALGMPLGVDADSGWVADQAVVANATLALLGLRPAHFTGSALDYRGTLLFDDAGAMPVAAGLPVYAEHYSRTEAPALPKTPRTAHKGSVGRVLLIAGAAGFAGAAVLSAEAAIAAGVGLLRVVTHAAHTSSLTVRIPEAVVEDADGWTGSELGAVDVIGVGSGLRADAWGRRLWQAALAADRPLVVDAGALRLLAQYATFRDDWILTPHPGEASALLGVDISRIQQDRFAAADKIAQRFGGVCILKGAGTIIATNERLRVCDHGSPALAIGGSGDVLAGLVAAFRAQGLSAADSAILGVAVHGRAGESMGRMRARGHSTEELVAALRMEMIRPQTAQDPAA